MENNLGLNLKELDGGKVTYENKKFTGSLKTIARLEKDGIVTAVSFVKGENKNLPAYLSLAQRLAGSDNAMELLGKETRELMLKGMTQASIATKLGKSVGYISQIVMLYRLNEYILQK